MSIPGTIGLFGAGLAAIKALKMRMWMSPLAFQILLGGGLTTRIVRKGDDHAAGKRCIPWLRARADHSDCPRPGTPKRIGQ